MTKNIPTALIDIHAKLVEKLEAQPYLTTSMTVNQEGTFMIHLYGAINYEWIFRASSFDPDETIQQALLYIETMLGKDERRISAWQKDLAKVIDEGHDLNLPDTVLAPLRSSSQAMTENLLEVST